MPLTMYTETELIERSKTATSCFDWHKVCGAECCKSYVLISDDFLKKRYRKGEVIRMPVTCSADMVWYYELHGARVINGVLTVKLIDFTQKGRRLTVHRTCNYLTNELKCAGYPTDRPSICQDFNRETAKYMPDYITPNCLFKYDWLREVN